MPPKQSKPKSTLDKFLGMIDIFGIADKAKKQVEQRKRDSISPAKQKADRDLIAQTQEEKERAEAMYKARLGEKYYERGLNTRNKSEFPKRIIEKAKRFKEQRSSN
tara:strand:+ start:38 stop:355 length:318 start_codon:yes stop_codon:yes gene_type:complete